MTAGTQPRGPNLVAAAELLGRGGDAHTWR
jgi:hypothetical protein